MPNEVDLTCPKCGHKNLISFAKIKKQLKAASVVFACGCALTPDQALEVMKSDVIQLLSKVNTNIGK